MRLRKATLLLRTLGWLTAVASAPCMILTLYIACINNIKYVSKTKEIHTLFQPFHISRGACLLACYHLHLLSISLIKYLMYIYRPTLINRQPKNMENIYELAKV
jgi:hypothetical protein